MAATTATSTAGASEYELQERWGAGSRIVRLSPQLPPNVDCRPLADGKDVRCAERAHIGCDRFCRAPDRRSWGLHERGGLVLSGSFYSLRAASHRRGIRSLPEVQTRHA
jgi:hypothetical protein